MPQYIDAYGFFLLRVSGAMILFWLSWLFMPKEKIALNDFPRIIAAAFFGVAFNMLTFLLVLLPHLGIRDYGDHLMIVLILSAIILKERMRKRMVAGIRTNGHGISYIIR
jgi:hypothetical protein